MKYLNYTGKLIWKLFAKSVVYVSILLVFVGSMLTNMWMIVVGVVLVVWMVIAYKLRMYSRSIVYSYTLANNRYLQRLNKEVFIKITEVDDGWKIDDMRYENKGFVKDLKVSWLKYQIVFWLLWGWVDDDCDRDTVPVGYGRDILEGKHFGWFPKWVKTLIKKEQDYLESRPNGNAFSLGNNLQKTWVPILSTMWMFRNLSYNFNYSLEEMREDDKNFFYKRYESKGWHFGYIPYTNKERKGRLVYLSEDFDKVDVK